MIKNIVLLFLFLLGSVFCVSAFAKKKCLSAVQHRDDSGRNTKFTYELPLSIKMKKYDFEQNISLHEEVKSGKVECSIKVSSKYFGSSIVVVDHFSCGEETLETNSSKWFTVDGGTKKLSSLIKCAVTDADHKAEILLNFNKPSKLSLDRYSEAKRKEAGGFKYCNRGGEKNLNIKWNSIVRAWSPTFNFDTTSVYSDSRIQETIFRYHPLRNKIKKYPFGLELLYRPEGKYSFYALQEVSLRIRVKDKSILIHRDSSCNGGAPHISNTNISMNSGAMKHEVNLFNKCHIVCTNKKSEPLSKVRDSTSTGTILNGL